MFWGVWPYTQKPQLAWNLLCRSGRLRTSGTSLRLCCRVGPYDQDVTGRKPVLFLVIIKYVEYLLFGAGMMMGTMLVIIIFGLMRCRLKRVVCQV